MSNQSAVDGANQPPAGGLAPGLSAASHTVRIHINREPYTSPTPTTGEALYTLGDVPKHQELFREIGGDHEDEPVPRDETVVHLKQDEHFYSQKLFKILVNGDEHDVNEKRISYAQVVDLYLGSGGKPSNEYLVKYSNGPKENPSGTLAPGQTVAVKNDMRFRVAGTGES
jgi:hypothetical protein